VFTRLVEGLKERQFGLDEDIETAMMISAAAKGLVCRRDLSAGASMECLSQCPWGLFLDGCTQWCAGKCLTMGSLSKKKKPVCMYVTLFYILLVQRIYVATNLQIILEHTIFFTVNSTWPIDFCT
jgi:hypothetical protein